MRRGFVLVLVVGVVWSAAGVVAAGAESRAECFGRDVTLDMGDLPAGEPGVGTRGADVILGTEGDDRIIGLGGDDLICGRGGDDDIRGGPGDDMIDAGDGDDAARGGPGDDVIYAGAGDDPWINGGTGDDELYGEAGDDAVIGGTGDDVIDGGPGDDGGAPGQDLVLLGQSGLDVITGGPGLDKLRGGAGNDTLDGGDGVDWVFGGAGGDAIDGGPGDDVIEGNGGADEIRGGDGDDLISGAKDPDEIYGDLGADTLLGGDGDDTLSGGDGDDVVLGEQGNDTLLGGDGDDTLNGAPGVDSDDGGAGADGCHRDDETRTGCEQRGGCLPTYGEPYHATDVGGAYEPGFLVGDYTGDGFDDLLVAWNNFGTPDTFEIDILVGDGGGGLEVDTGTVLQGDVPRLTGLSQGRVYVADFNGDGHDDAFLPDFGMDAFPFPGAQNVLLLSAPGGRLRNATADLPQLIDNPHDAAVGDADGDGDLDVFLVVSWGAPLIEPYLMLNDGSGRFTIGGSLPPDVEMIQNWFVAAAFTDVDRDEDLDLVLGSSGDPMGNTLSVPGSMVLLNDGAAGFTVLPGALPFGPFTDDPIGGQGYHLLPVDLDRDGYQDLILNSTRVDYVGRMLQILINNGDGTFRDETATRVSQSVNSLPFIGVAELVDVNRDGAPDVLARPFGDPDPQPFVYLNDGRGTFLLTSHDFGIETLYYDFLDLDGDGGRDIVTAQYSFGPQQVPIWVIPDAGCS